MKFTPYKKVTLAAVGLFFAAPSVATELLLNGNFESGMASWTPSIADESAMFLEYDTDNTPEPSGLTPYAGSQFFWGYDNRVTGGTLSQTIASGSSSYLLQFGLKTVGGTGVIGLDNLSVTRSGSTYTVSGYRIASVDDGRIIFT